MNLFDFNDTASFLRNHILALPKRGRGEISRIARRLRVSPTLVSQVLARDKFFTLEQGRTLGEHLGFVGIEMEYLLNLILRERAGTKELQKHWHEKLLEIRNQSKQVSRRVQKQKALSMEDQAIFYSSPIYSAIRLYTSIGSQGKSIEEICTRFALSRKKVVAVLHFLCGVDLVKEVEGKFFLGLQSTHLEAESKLLTRHHHNWRIKGMHCADSLSPDELMYTAPVSLSRKDFARLREEMVQFIQGFLKTVHQSPAEEIACFCMDFFWVKN